jgi:pyrimidine-nucleoside phosphorylase
VAEREDFRDVLARKRDGRELTEDEVRGFVLAYARGDVGDPVAAAFLMAAYIRGLSVAETTAMTRAMIDSGDVLPLESVSRPTVDKHSTGGVADGVTLVFAPLAASVGLAVAKLSGRGLGHTGGTLDKLEAIPGFRTALTVEELEAQVERVGCAVAGQTADLVPADGALYALRDATATVASIPLIAASIMSKKLAVETDLILLDVKAGDGAFMKNPAAAGELAEACVSLAAQWDRPCRAAVTDMSQPLGTAVGNALDVAEAIRVLRGDEAGRLRDLAVFFVARALTILDGSTQETARAETEAALSDGRAAEAFARMIEAQDGDPRAVDDPDGILPVAPVRTDVEAPRDAWLASVETEAVGRAAMALGAGRVHKGDPVDPAVGVELFPKVGDAVRAGDLLGRIHARDAEAAARAKAQVLEALGWSDERVDALPLTYAWVGEAPRT